MADERDRSVCIGENSPLSMRSLSRFDIDPEAFQVLYESRERFDLGTREHLLARITPKELVFIEYVCHHPEKTDEEIMNALGLRERTVQAYYSHFKRNFKVRSSAQLRRWANKNRLVSLPDDDAVVDLPDDRPSDGAKGPLDAGFDPWVRRY